LTFDAAARVFEDEVAFEAPTRVIVVNVNALMSARVMRVVDRFRILSNKNPIHSATFSVATVATVAGFIRLTT